MGKQKRNKRRSNNKDHAKQGAPADATNPNGTTGPAIVQRIRHADARTRHAALCALLHTCNFASGAKCFHRSVLQAVRDSIMDVDLECALAAVAILTTTLQQEDSSSKMDPTVSAGWLVLLHGRLQSCATEVDQKDPKMSLPWLNLASCCLQCACVLVETNSLALERLVPESGLRTSELRDAFWPNVSSWLSQALQQAAGEEASVGTTEVSRVHSEHWETIAIWAARIFHSCWDDEEADGSLIQSWYRDQRQDAQATFQVLHRAAISRTHSIPVPCRLHAVGALLSVGKNPITLSSGTSFSARQEDVKFAKEDTWEPMLLDACMGVLRESLQWHESTASQLVQKLAYAHEAWKAQAQDAELEKSIISLQRRKNEPARQIARRLQQQPDNVDDSEQCEKGRGKLPVDRQDKETVYYEAEATWNQHIRGLQLALEITANLTSDAGAASYCHEDTVMTEDESSATSLDYQLTTSLLRHDVPMQLWRLLRPLTDYTSQVDSASLALVAETCGDLQSKAALCLGHVLANIPSWAPPDSLWTDLQTAVKRTTAMEGRQGLCACMVVYLRSRGYPSLQTLQPSDLQFLRSLILGHDYTPSDTVPRDAVCMMGLLLCSHQTHSAEVNEVFARTLLETNVNSGTSAILLAEILNTFMDVYGTDAHPAVFDNLNVLGFFQKSIPALKQKISIASSCSATRPEDLEVWKEAATNAARFVLYKKGYA
jgi:hypothetical protein